MLINELSKKTSLTSHTIRFYEEEGLLDKRHIQRGENNFRYYSEAAIERLMLIKQAQTTGFTIAEIKALAEAYDAGSLTTQQQAASLQQKIEAIDAKIAELKQLQTYLTNKLARISSEENAG